MRPIAFALLLALAACGGPDETAQMPTAVVPSWSCDGGVVTCPNASREYDLNPYPYGVESLGAAVCEWDCADYQGMRGSLSLFISPTCSASERPVPRIPCE